MKKKKVALGMSGGVDSSVAALLLKEQGYDVVGVFMQCWDAKADGCKSDEDRDDAVKVAAKLGIKFESLDFVKEYKDKVIRYFFDEYKKGRTPNPDVLCNKEIKFGLFLEWALGNNFDYIATGHYARVVQDDSCYKLLKGKDPEKDQSYFLYRLTQEQLSRTLFPLGEMAKKDVRKIAQANDLHNAQKKDSVGICFIGEVDIKDFLMKEIKPAKGVVINTSGEEIGEHDGVWYYTIGQRHGFTIHKYVGLPLYVVGKNVEKNELVVGFVKEVLSEKLVVEDMSWICPPASMQDNQSSVVESAEPMGMAAVPDRALSALVDVRIRHLGELFPCQISFESVGEVGTQRLTVDLEEKVFGIAPGQSAVFYDGDVVLGGGIIS